MVLVWYRNCERAHNAQPGRSNAQPGRSSQVSAGGRQQIWLCWVFHTGSEALVKLAAASQSAAAMPSGRHPQLFPGCVMHMQLSLHCCLQTEGASSVPPCIKACRPHTVAHPVQRTTTKSKLPIRWSYVSEDVLERLPMMSEPCNSDKGSEGGGAQG